MLSLYGNVDINHSDRSNNAGCVGTERESSEDTPKNPFLLTPHFLEI